MYKNIAIFMATLATAVVANAAEYRIDFSGQMAVNPAAGSVYGVAPGSIVVVSGSAVVDSSLGAITERAAGSVVDSGSGQVMTVATTTFAMSSIKSFSMTMGNKVWSLSEIQENVFGSFGSFGLLVQAPLSSTSSSPFWLQLNDLGYLSATAGEFTCAEPAYTQCSIFPVGQADDYNGAGGTAVLSGLTATITSLTKTPSQQLTDLQAQVVSINLKQGIANSLDSKLSNARAALDEALDKDKPSAINMLYAFINSVEAQRNKVLTTAQADSLIAAANKIISTLNGN